jgi:ComF family protein
MDGFRRKLENAVKKVVGWILDAAFPEQCVVCGASGNAFCVACETGVLAHPASRVLADGTRAVGLYSYATPAVRTILGAYKFSSRSGAGDALFRLTQRACANVATLLPGEPVVLVPIPLASRRERERGFNQAERFAQALLPACPDGSRVESLLVRTRMTAQQSMLPKEERAGNVAHAFALRKGAVLPGVPIVIVDDVVTSGETLRAAVAVLRTAGATRISALTFAHAG